MAPHGRLRAPAGIWCASLAFAYYHDSGCLVVDGVACQLLLKRSAQPQSTIRFSARGA